jgi:hypothetical protein
MTLNTLADRVEKLSGPDREVDAMIAVALDYGLPPPMGECRASLRMPRASHDYERVEPGHYWLVQMSGMSLRSAPLFTASLDAAMTLVPEGWGRVEYGRYIKPADQFWAQISSDHLLEGSENCTTPALALCAAALRARSKGEAR